LIKTKLPPTALLASPDRLLIGCIVLMLVVAGIVTACVTTRMTTLTLGAADNGKSLEVEQGDAIVLRLSENPTTGFRWELEQSGGPVLEATGDSFGLAADPSVGSGGTREFRFVAKSSGSSQISLKHWQAWEGDRSVTERFSVRVTVAP
jgi:inhibitor of cysteine peptidase